MTTKNLECLGDKRNVLHFLNYFLKHYRLARFIEDVKIDLQKHETAKMFYVMRFVEIIHSFEQKHSWRVK